MAPGGVTSGTTLPDGRIASGSDDYKYELRKRASASGLRRDSILCCLFYLGVFVNSIMPRKD